MYAIRPWTMVLRPPLCHFLLHMLKNAARNDIGGRLMELTAIAKSNNGLITAAQAKTLGIQGARLSEAVRAGILVRVARGVYCLPDVWEDELAIASMRFPKGILSHGTALYFHDMTDRTPEQITMTFARGYNASSARGGGCAGEELPGSIDRSRKD